MASCWSSAAGHCVVLPVGIVTPLNVSRYHLVVCNGAMRAQGSAEKTFVTNSLALKICPGPSNRVMSISNRSVPSPEVCCGHEQVEEGARNSGMVWGKKVYRL